MLYICCYRQISLFLEQVTEELGGWCEKPLLPWLRRQNSSINRKSTFFVNWKSKGNKCHSSEHTDWLTSEILQKQQDQPSNESDGAYFKKLHFRTN